MTAICYMMGHKLFSDDRYINVNTHFTVRIDREEPCLSLHYFVDFNSLFEHNGNMHW